MNEIVEKIDGAAHIVLISHVNPDGDSLGSASAMYSYLLQKHKKVSWFCANMGAYQRFSCIPWIENIKTSYPLGADLAISFDCVSKELLDVEVGCTLVNIGRCSTSIPSDTLFFVESNALSTTEILYRFFQENSTKINKKMATALYVGLLEKSEGFLANSVDGTTFATVKELITLGADFQICNKKIMKSVSLAALRLKAIMLKDMLLEHNATIALFCISDDEMKESGAILLDADRAMQESLCLPHVQVAVLLIHNGVFSVKGSLRSEGSVDCGLLARFFDGGGEANRADFVLNDNISLKAAKERIINLIKKEIVF